MIDRLWDGMKSILAFAVALMLGVLVTAAAFFFKILPDRERKRKLADIEARMHAEGLRVSIQKAHDARAAATTQKVAEIDKQASAQKAQDSVALANALLKEE